MRHDASCYPPARENNSNSYDDGYEFMFFTKRTIEDAAFFIPT